MRLTAILRKSVVANGKFDDFLVILKLSFYKKLFNGQLLNESIAKFSLFIFHRR